MDRSHARKKKVAGRSAAPPALRENLLLAALPAAERRRLIARCEPVELTFGNVLCEQGDRIEHVYFPTDSFISLLSSMDGRPRLEVGLIGAEGMQGVSLILGVTDAPLRALVQGAGTALRLDAAQFSLALEQSPALERGLKRYLYVLMSQLAQMAACTRFHIVEARLARWLLMTRDRAHSNEFYLTQEFIAYMLGVRRAGITRAAGVLQKRKLIHYSRGVVTVLDGRRLAAAACECYLTSSEMYARVMQ
jgi:CRP-like cAMP-binding protein